MSPGRRAMADDTLDILARCQRAGLKPTAEAVKDMQATYRVILDGQTAGGGYGVVRIRRTTGRVHDGWLRHGHRDDRIPDDLRFTGPAGATAAVARYEKEQADGPGR